MAGVLLVISCQSPLLNQPAEAALNDPAAWQHHEALLVLKLLDDAKGKAGCVTEQPAHVLHEGFKLSGVATVGEDHEQVQEAVSKQAEQQFRAVTIPHTGGCDHHHAQQQAVGVSECVALAPFDLFACVVAAAYSR